MSDDPDDPARQDDVARRLAAFAARLRGKADDEADGADEKSECGDGND
jgi:hypothetical protein